MSTWPPKTNYAAGDILTAAQMTDIGNQMTPLGYTAGKNKIINGDFGINQRAFSSITTDLTYGFDRWMLNKFGGTATYSAQTFTPGTAPVAGYEGVNFARLVTVSQSAAGDFAAISQRIEDVRTFAGQTVIFSFWAKASTGTPKVGITLTQNFGSGGSSEVVTSATPITISSSWARYSATISVPSVSGKTIGASSFLTAWLFTSVGTSVSAAGYPAVGIQNVTIDFWGVQLEAGSVATAFQTATGTKQGELAACQRYYPVIPAGSVLMGYAYASSGAILNYTLPVTPRVAPTGISITALSTFDGYNAANSQSTPTNITTNSLGQWGGALLAAFTCTAATPVRLVLTTGTIGFTGCEL